MSFEFGKGQYYSRIFFAEIHVGRQGNMMGAVFTEPGTCEWIFRYRFRWYNDDLFDNTSKDEKNWYEAKGADKPLTELLDGVRLMFAAASGVAGVDGYSELVIESDQPEKILEILGAQPWAHLSQGQPE